jgi:hypothetical protein
MNTIFGNFLERTIPNLRNAIINLTIGGNNAEMNLEDFKAVMAPEPTPIPEPSYKVYTALLTQSGGDDSLGLWGDGDGDLTSAAQGATVLITANPNNTDYSFIGAPNSNEGTYFVLTQDISYTDLDVDTIFDINLGAPTVTVLENTIGNIWFTYVDTGYYQVNSNELFTADKTTAILSPNLYIESGADVYTNYISWSSAESNLGIITAYNNEYQNSTLNNNGNVMLEIRVYN